MENIYLYGISTSFRGMYGPTDMLFKDYKPLAESLEDNGFEFLGEDESGFEFGKDGTYKKIFKYLLVKDSEEE